MDPNLTTWASGGTAVLAIVMLTAFMAGAAWVAMGSPRFAGAPARAAAR